MQQPALSGDPDPTNDSQSSVQKILHGMMMSSSQLGAGVGNDAKTNTALNGPANSNSSIGGGAFGSMGNGLGQSAMVNGIRGVMGGGMNGRVGVTMAAREQSMNNNHQHDLGNQLLNGFGSVNSFNNLQFDWKGSP